MGVTAGIFLASILLKEMRYLVYIRYPWFFLTTFGRALTSSFHIHTKCHERVRSENRTHNLEVKGHCSDEPRLIQPIRLSLTLLGFNAVYSTNSEAAHWINIKSGKRVYIWKAKMSDLLHSLSLISKLSKRCRYHLELIWLTHFHYLSFNMTRGRAAVFVTQRARL
jgi:low affinity Fe/Cu permease